MKGIIDRFEDQWVVVEINDETQDFSREMFPENAKVGDIVEIEGKHIKILKKETEQRRQEIEDLMNELWED